MAKKEEKKADPKEEKDAAAKPEGDAAADGVAESDAGGKKKLPTKMIIIIAFAVVLLLGGVAAALVFTGVLGDKKVEAHDKKAGGEHGDDAAKDAHASEGKDEHKEEDDTKHSPIFYDLGEVIVNLQTDGKRQIFLKLVIHIELRKEEDKAVMETIKPRIVDNFQSYLRELRIDDLRGSAGIYRLREELLFRVTEAAHPVKIKDVLIQQMLVQ